MDKEGIHKYSTSQSPGDGVTSALMSSEPLATEGEATPGPDDENPFEDALGIGEERTSREMEFPELPDFGQIGNDGRFPDYPDF